MRPFPVVSLIAGIALGGCGPVNRGLDSVKQPVVGANGAYVPGCPDWRGPSQPNFSGSTTSNHGCAVNSNLAAMVADPQDLLRGVPHDGVDARTINKAIRAYRDAPTTGTGGLKIESTRAGR